MLGTARAEEGTALYSGGLDVTVKVLRGGKSADSNTRATCGQKECPKPAITAQQLIQNGYRITRNFSVKNVQANNLHNEPGFAIMQLLLESEQRFRQRA